MTLVTPFSVGSLRCHALEAGIQKLDGGAMFGVVPRPLWSRRVTPDDRNRISLALRCILIDHPDGPTLLDTGIGNKESEKFADIYGVANVGRTGPTQLEDALAEAGVEPKDIRWVINTHLHFDHAGGNTVREGSAVRLAFPNATYVVQKGELEYARHTNERTQASYLPPNFEPIADAGRWQLIEGDQQILPGIRARLVPGHVPFLQAIIIEDGEDTAVFVADLIPTVAHLPLPWIMGYDVEPLRTLESKRALLDDASTSGWRLVFEHDPDIVSALVVPGERGHELVDALKAPPPPSRDAR